MRRTRRTRLIIAILITVGAIYTITSSHDMSPWRRTCGRWSESWQQVCKPRKNIVFIKTHKCGSSTISNILLRYGMRYGLDFALPVTDSGHIGWPNSLLPEHMDALPPGRKYNLLVHHATYNRTTLDRVMSSGAVYVSILREPFQQFRSALTYFVEERRQFGFRTDDPVTEFLSNPARYERRLRFTFDGVNFGKRSITRNFMAAEFGYVPPNSDNKINSDIRHMVDDVINSDIRRDEDDVINSDIRHTADDVINSDIHHTADDVINSDIRRDEDDVINSDIRHTADDFINSLDSEFQLILMMEYFAESVILLRRLLCWTIEDVIYVGVNTKHVHVTRQSDVKDVRHLEEIYRNYSRVDYRIYERFNATFWRKIAQQKPDFFDELTHYKNIIQEVRTFCVNNGHQRQPILTITRSKWNDEFPVSYKQCREMAKPPKLFTYQIGRQMRLPKYGR